MATRFTVEGANKKTGAEQRLEIEADDASQAGQIASVRGLFVSAIHPIAESSRGPAGKRKATIIVAITALLGVVCLTLVVLKHSPTTATTASAKKPTASENQLKALATLKRLQAKVEVGMNFSDYSAALADTWADVKGQLHAPGSDANARFSECLTDAINDYKTANESWNQIIAPDRDDEDRRLAVQAAEIGAMWDGPAKETSALKNEIQVGRKKLITKQKNEMKRQASWQMADAAISEADAVIAGDSAKESQFQNAILKLQADLKTDLDERDAKYRHPD